MRRYQEILILLFFLYQQSLYSQQLDMNLPLEIMDGFPEFGNFDYEEDKELRNESKARIEKVKRGLRLSAGYNLTIGAGLLIMPSKVTHWKREDFFKTAGPNLGKAWTKEPVWDKDAMITNYVGHPYQGAFYYNSMRSQGAKVWESSLFCLGQTLMWEFVFEAIKEQPSRQDLITTPIGGILFGELIHRGTLRMRRGGFRAWEKVLITVFNPSYVLNNGYR